MVENPYLIRRLFGDEYLDAVYAEEEQQTREGNEGIPNMASNDKRSYSEEKEEWVKLPSKKPRQAQKKPDGTTAKPLPTCQKCGKILTPVYSRGPLRTGKRGFLKEGWACPDKKCDYIIKEFVELE